ncbi:cytochrome P450 307a1 [Penaeus vannamei]|nr:cytochrome P450 307a1-like [Penaeus vannamei]
MVFILAPATLVLMVVVVLAAALKEIVRRRNEKQCANVTSKSRRSEDLEIARPATAPGPKALPIFGNIFNLAKYGDCPYEGFTALAKEYGPVYSLYLGSNHAVVISSIDTIKEVLVTKGNMFDARPNIIRFGLYFGGDRQHSLALCDMNTVQKKRINLARSVLMFRTGESHSYEKFEENVISEMPTLTDEIDKVLNKPVPAKELLSYCAMNIFTGFICSTKFDYSDPAFRDLARKFDFVFEDINNGHPTDFLPWLAPFFCTYLKDIQEVAAQIRQIILEKICNDKYNQLKCDPTNIKDLADAYFANLLNENKDNETWDWQAILYIIEDLLGGSSAIGNIVMRIFGYVLQNPHVYEKLRAEIDEKIGKNQTPKLNDKSEMIYTQAVVLEVLRLTSSPIVPHVATADTTIGGYAVEKGAIVLPNIFGMNTDSELWDEPEKFMPERFIVDGQLKKPSHFIPFSTGKRACVGSKVVGYITFMVMSTVFQKYDVSLPEGTTPVLPKGKISLPWNSFELVFSKREH